MMAERRGSLPQTGEDSVHTTSLPTTIPQRTTEIQHHWLTLLVARPGPHDPVPAKMARVVVRPFPRGSQRPGDIIARGTTAADGTVSLLLPEGRYAVAAAHDGDGRAVTVTLHHAGRAIVLLESLGRRVQLTVEASRPDGGVLAEGLVEARAVPGNSLAARAVTDERGVVQLSIPPGAYEIRVGKSITRTYVESDTLLRITAVPGATVEQSTPVTGYAKRVRIAASYVAPYDVDHVREDVWN